MKEALKSRMNAVEHEMMVFSGGSNEPCATRVYMRAVKDLVAFGNKAIYKIEK